MSTILKNVFNHRNLNVRKNISRWFIAPLKQNQSVAAKIGPLNYRKLNNLSSSYLDFRSNEKFRMKFHKLAPREGPGRRREPCQWF